MSLTVGDAGEVWVPAKDGQPGESLETPLVHPEEWRDPLLQISCEFATCHVCVCVCVYKEKQQDGRDVGVMHP